MATVFIFLLLLIIFRILFFLSILTFNPIETNRSIIVNTSLTKGKFFIIIFFSLKIVEANIGKVAFFDPEIDIEPDNFFFPLITNFFIKN